MPRADNDGVSLYYEAAGEGGGRGDETETVAFVGDAGFGAWQWGWQYAALAGPYRTLVADLRGAGRSDAPPGPYAVDDLASDLDAVLADAGVRTAHVAGAGLGGMVALRAAREGSRVRSLSLFGTAASGEGVDPRTLYADPTDESALRESLSAALSDDFLDAHPDEADRIVRWRAEGDAAPDAFAAQAAAVEAFDLSDALYEVTTPALVVHGAADAAWPVEAGHELADGLPRGEFFGVEGAGHLVHAEASGTVNDRLLGFLESVG